MELCILWGFDEIEAPDTLVMLVCFGAYLR